MSPANSDLGEEMGRRAKVVAARASDLGVPLDFSIGSCERLDGMLAETFSSRHPLKRRRGALRSADPRFIEAIGAYVGEVLRRRIDCSWAVNDEYGQYALRTASGAWIFPIAKAYKRFENGREDVLGFYAEVMVDLYGGPSHDI